MRWMLGFLAAAIVLAVGIGSAQAPSSSTAERYALVIGNAAYRTPGWELQNPVNDANLIAARLQNLDFQVTVVRDGTKQQMEAAMNAFTRRVSDAGPEAVGVFYYAGHGVEHDGANLLVPVDVTARSMDELRYQAPPMQFLLRDLARAGNSVNILVLDACRDLPLPSGSRTGPAGGLAELADVPSNVLIAYATRPGLTAPDHPSEPNSIFTRTLADAMHRTPHHTVVTLFSRVQAQVYQATEQLQRPEFRSGLLRAPDWRFSDVEVDVADRTPPPAPKTRPGETFRECDVCSEMVVVPAGSFTMGSPANEPERDSDETQHPVTIARPFAVGKFEVTFAQWDACVAANGCAPPEEGPYSPPDSGWGRDNRPVINVSWQDAKRYVRWLNGRVGGRAYRLLSEAEWEYAARAGSTTAYSTGASIAPSQANFSGSGLRRTQPVGSYAPNAFGLHDMHGNVWEWVEDCYVAENALLTREGAANTSQGCHSRVLRGGSWNYDPQYLRSANRFWSSPAARSIYLGFRVARTVFTP